jgi:hypothetical protein
MSEPRFAAIVPVGPTDVDLRRARLVVESLLYWEPDVAWCVIVDDAPQPRALADSIQWPSTCRPVTMLNPRRGQGHLWIGAVSAGVLEAMSWIQEHTDADLVLKVETDALVIGAFATNIRAFLAEAPDAGIVGALGWSGNPEARAIQDLNEEPWLLKAYRKLPPATDGDDETQPMVVPDIGRVSNQKRRLFDSVRPHIEAAIHRGYASNHYIQGGVHVVTRRWLDAMAIAGYFATSGVWAQMIFPEEPILAMYTRALDLQLYDCSGVGQPFGVQYIGLPYSPEELVSRGHALIHSIKNDKRHSEAEIMAFFRGRMRRGIDEDAGIAPGLSARGDQARSHA